MQKQIITKSFNIRGADGNDLRICETVEREWVEIVIQQNDDKGRLATVILNKEQFEAFFELKYSLEIHNIEKKGEEVNGTNSER